MGKSQIPVLHKNIKSFILKSQILWPNSKYQSLNLNLKIQNPNQIPIFHKYINTNCDLYNREGTLAVCQCHCQCYSTACLQCLCDSAHSYSSRASTLVTLTLYLRSLISQPDTLNSLSTLAIEISIAIVICPSLVFTEPHWPDQWTMQWPVIMLLELYIWHTATYYW